MTSTRLRRFALAVLVSAAWPLPVLAQSASNSATETSADADEIVVTATRRAGSVQDAPLAIAAFDAEALAARSIATVEDVGALAAGVQIARYQGDTSIYIRGIGTPSIIAGNDSSTAAYLDGAYLSRAAAIGPAFFDVARIEVLRGPQGTLYGRNATGGAVNIVTQAPNRELSGDAALTIGNYGQVRAHAAIGGPLSSALRARLAIQTEQRGGYATAVRPGPGGQDERDKVDDRRDVGVRLTLAADLGSDAELTLFGDYYSADDQANVFYYASAGYAEGNPSWYASREGAQTAPYFQIKNAGRVTARKSRELFADTAYANDVEVWGLGGRLRWALGGAELQLLGGYRQTGTASRNEFDLSDTFNTYVGRAEDHWQWNVDMQLASSGDQAVSWILGAGYFREDNLIDNDVFGDFWEPILIQGLTDLQTAGVLPPFPVVIPQTTACCELQLSGQQSTEAFAAYAEGEWAASDALTLRLGGRYSWERRDGAQRFELLFRPDIRFAPEVAFFPNAVSNDRDTAQPDPFGFIVAPVRGPATFDAFTPKLALEYRTNRDLLIYASAQRGFKSGGYNIGSSQRDPYQPETIWSYELGAKFQSSDGKITLNTAAFYYDYSNLQAQDSVANQPIIRNVGKARVLGFEVEARVNPAPGVQLEASLTHLDASFTKGALTEPLLPAPLTQPPGSVVRNLDGLHLPRAPRWKLGSAVQWTGEVGEAGQIQARLSYVWQSKVYFTIFNIDAASEPGYGLLDARLAYSGADRRWSIALFGKNLTNEAYFTNQILTGTVYGGEFVGSMGPPRTYGIELRANF